MPRFIRSVDPIREQDLKHKRDRYYLDCESSSFGDSFDSFYLNQFYSPHSGAQKMWPLYYWYKNNSET